MGTTVHPKNSKLLNLTPAHPDHAYALAPNLRKADIREIRAHHPRGDIGVILSMGIETSDQAFTICSEDTIHGIWGHGTWPTGGPTHGSLGFIWMVTDDILFKQYPATITRAARREIFPALDKLYGSYGNWVHSKNLVHVRWLLGAGFKQRDHAIINSEPFTLYTRCVHLLPQRS